MAEIKVTLKHEDMEAIATLVVTKLRNTTAVIPTTYTVAEVASITKKHTNTILNHIKQGLLHATRTGKEYIITGESLDDYIKKKKPSTTEVLEELRNKR